MKLYGRNYTNCVNNYDGVIPTLNMSRMRMGNCPLQLLLLQLMGLSGFRVPKNVFLAWSALSLKVGYPGRFHLVGLTAPKPETVHLTVSG